MEYIILSFKDSRTIVPKKNLQEVFQS